MTREERFKMDMVDEFKQMCEIVEEGGRIIENKQRMLKALEQEPCKDVPDISDGNIYDSSIKTELKPCEDCISRQYLLDNCVVDKVTMPYVPVSKIENAPPVTPQPKMGRWIEEINDYGKVVGWHCSKCYEDTGFTTDCKWDFCPKCGVKTENAKDKISE